MAAFSNSPASAQPLESDMSIIGGSPMGAAMSYAASDVLSQHEKQVVVSAAVGAVAMMAAEKLYQITVDWAK